MRIFTKLMGIGVLLLLLVASNTFASDEIEILFGKQQDLAPDSIDPHDDEWSIDDTEYKMDKVSYKHQYKSIIEWNNVEPNKWLNFTDWKNARALRDKDPLWKMDYRDSVHVETIGKVLSCVGKCRLYRGLSYVQASYTSQILEGDEIQTQKDSYLWVYLMDGTLIRVSPNSSLSMNEINISEKTNMYYIRLNSGHVHWSPRLLGTFEDSELVETDLMFLPLKTIQANRGYFARKKFQTLKDLEKLKYETVKEPGHTEQYSMLNKLLDLNKEAFSKKDTLLFLVAPNVTIESRNTILDIHYAVNGKSIIKTKDSYVGFEKLDKREQYTKTRFRGYNNKKTNTLVFDQWMEVNRNGRTLGPLEDKKELEILDFFVRRIPTIHLAREHFLRKYSSFMQLPKYNREDLAKEFGYRKWNQKSDELSERVSWLHEYTRRIETTNLVSLANLYQEEKIGNFSTDFYQGGIRRYLGLLKNHVSRDNSIVKSMNDLEYYVWIVKKNESK